MGTDFRGLWIAIVIWWSLHSVVFVPVSNLDRGGTGTNWAPVVTWIRPAASCR